MSIDRKALFNISYGLYVVSASDGNGRKSGFVGNTVFQITSKPPRLAVGVSRDNFTHGVIVDSGSLAISVLSRNAELPLIQTFGYKSSRDIDKFADLAFRPGDNGAPLVTEGTYAWFECSVSRILELETHDIFICEVTAANVADGGGSPMTYEYYREVLKGKAPKNAPTFVEQPTEPVESAAANAGEKRVCSVCRYEYDPAKGDPEHGIEPGTSFDDLPDDWRCPICGSPKDVFK